MSQLHALEYIRSGQASFFRLPLARLDQSGPATYQGADAVILGVPWDGGTTYQPGARLGPYHLRRVSALIQSHHPAHKVDVFGVLRAVDGGNIVTPPFDAALARSQIQAEVGHVLAAEAVPFLAGGDHSITLPALRAVAKVHGPVAVVHLDAHLDTSTAELWGEQHHHGTVFRHALEEGLIAPRQLHQVGLRATWGSPNDAALSEKHGATVVGIDELAEVGVVRVAHRILSAIGPRPTWISFDVDAVDPAFAPGTGTPVPGGLSSREAIAFLRALRGVRPCGMDVVEVAPSLDHADITCHLGAQLLYEGLALLARSKRPSSVP
jgi:agmatinase